MRKLRLLLFHVLLLLTLNASASTTDSNEPALLFSYFKGNGSSGLHLAWSRDGLNWTALNQGNSILTPEVGGKLMRDPCIIVGPDETFHMVWTSGWWERSIGVAHSKDLLNWSGQKLIPVMEHEPNALNAWAPEILYDPDTASFVIHWATTLPDRFPAEAHPDADYDAHGNPLNHRMYFTRTRDFKTYTATELLYDPGFNCIDATIHPVNGRWVMFIKDETKVPKPQKNIRMAWADNATGPFGPAGEPISSDWVEGPTAWVIDGEWYLYVDAYTRGGFEGMKSSDLKHWECITDQLSFPEGARHGSVFEIQPQQLETLLKWDSASKE